MKLPRGLFLMGALLIAGTCVSQVNGDTPSPNFLVILADDLGWGDAACYNPESKIPMPNLNALAREGMRFTDAHSPSAVCTPTRYGLLTGRFCWRSRLKSGVLYGYSPALIEADRLTLPAFLREQGYTTGCVGKWHLGLQDNDKTDYSQPLRPGPLEAGFDQFFGIPASLDMEPYCYIRNAEPTQPITGMIEGSRHRRQNGGGFWRGGGIADDFKHIDVLPRIGDEAIAFLAEQANTSSVEESSQPFFLYVPLSAPHTPWLPIDEFRGKTEVGYYGDFTVQVDYTIGRILEALDQHGLKDNTLVVVTSDNGSHWPVGDIKKYGHRANGPWRGQKADIHEGGHRVPFLVRWPGQVDGGAVSDQTLCLTDLFATFADLLQQEIPTGQAPDSVSMLPVFTGEQAQEPRRETIVNHSVRGLFAIRQGDWKLILGRGSGGFTAPRTIEPGPGEPQGQLYNLADDPAETKNLYSDMPEKVEELTAVLEAIREGD